MDQPYHFVSVSKEEIDRAQAVIVAMSEYFTYDESDFAPYQ